MPDDFRAGLISQWYAPEPVLIPKTLSDAMVRAGHSVKVLTAFPSYPGGIIYEGFHSNVSSQQENFDGAAVLRVKTFVSHDESAVRRIRSFLSFAWSSVRCSRFLNSCDAIYVYGTPMTATIAAVKLRITRGTPFVIHLQDLWPESVIDSGMLRSERVMRLFSAIIGVGLKFIYRAASHIIVISPGMKETLLQRGVDGRKISVLLNWHTSEHTSDDVDLIARSRGDFIHCVYAGNIGLMQDIETVIRAAAQVQDELPLRVSIYGSGLEEQKAQALARELDARNVSFMGRVSAEEMRAVYQRSDFQLVTLKDRDVFRVTIPSKFQASMANGVPVITTVKGDLSRICKQNQLGLVAEPENPLSLAEAFRAAARLGPAGREAMEKRCRKFYWETMSADNGTEHIMARLAEAVAGRRKRNSIAGKYEGNKNAAK